MNEYFLKLANENFYASSDAMRNFFMLGMNEKAFTFDDAIEKKSAISNYGTEYNTIEIRGMMLREQSWITDLGFATSTEQVISGIKETLDEGKKVKLKIDSGGGLVSGTSNLADIIYKNRDNIEAYATGMVASAAMWVFSAAGTRYSESTTVMGSIGVVTSVLDDENYWKAHGIIWKEIVSENAKNKRPDVKTEEGQNEVKRYLTSLEEVFITAVSKHLGMSADDVVSNFHQGGLITGSDALKLGVINSLTSYDLATMPTELSAEKIENKNTGETVMEVTKEELDAVQAQLDEANASVTALSAEKNEMVSKVGEIDSKVETLSSELESANAKLSGMGEIIGMAFEHNVSKDVAMKMVEAGSKESAALVILESKQSTGATVVAEDLDNSAVEEASEEASEVEAAIAYAKKISVNKK